MGERNTRTEQMEEEHNNIHTKSVVIEFSKFKRYDPSSWLYKVKQFFNS
jgi:hypothetical protein